MNEKIKEPVSIELLKQRFLTAENPLVNDPLCGECLVIPGIDFNPDWESELADQGYKCYFSSLNSQAVTLVRLKKAVPNGKVVYVPPKIKVEPKSEVNESQNASLPPQAVRTEVAEKKKYVLKGLSWSKEEVNALVKEYDRLVSEGKKYGAANFLAEMPQFKNRTLPAIMQKLRKLGLTKKRRSKKKEQKIIATVMTDESQTYRATNKGLALALDSLTVKFKILSEAYEANSKGYIELKNEFYGFKTGVGELAKAVTEMQATANVLDTMLSQHEHASSGKALFPRGGR